MTFLSQVTAVAAFLMLPACGHAQNGSKESKWTITPRAGMTISTLTGDDAKDDVYDTRVGFGGGVEAEYHFNRTVGLSLGAFYTRQGAKINAEMLAATKAMPTDGIIDNGDGNSILNTVVGKNAHFNIADYAGEYDYVERIHNLKANLGYINIPLMLNVHLPLRLPVDITAKAGAQMDILVSAKAKGDLQTYESGNYSNTSYSSTDLKDNIKDIGLSIPAGLAVSYKNIELDARYLWDITDINDADVLYDAGKNHNSTFLITLGYRFNL